MTVAESTPETGDAPVDTVGIISPGGRTDKITDGLATTTIDYAVNPDRLAGYDAIICDTPDREMFATVARKPLHRTPVIFRMRGDPFWGLDQWIDSRAKRWVALQMLGLVDGCIAIAPHQAKKYQQKTGVPTRLAKLPIEPDEWPTTEHTDEKLRIITLTNAVYPNKIEPVIGIIPTVDQVLSQVGGHWQIGSWSTGHHDRLADAAGDYEHVSFDLKLDAKAELERANVMIHFSNFDVLPNAILEGMASRVPVITNDHQAFTDSAAPLTICRKPEDLPRALHWLTKPDERAAVADEGLEYVQQNHTPERIGQQYVNALRHFLGGDGA